MTTYADLQQAMRGRICVLCSSEPRIAYLEGELKLRCNCHPKAPVLGRPPKSELAKALADPNYATDSVTRMQAERILDKRRAE